MSIVLSRAVLLPVEHLKEVAENVSMGNLQITVRRFSDDEIGDLATPFYAWWSLSDIFRWRLRHATAFAKRGVKGEMSEITNKVLAISKPYLGPATEAFLGRQC